MQAGPWQSVSWVGRKGEDVLGRREQFAWEMTRSSVRQGHGVQVMGLLGKLKQVEESPDKFG